MGFGTSLGPRSTAGETNRCAQLQVVSDCWHLEITEINVTVAHGGVDRKDVWGQYEMG